MVAAHLLEGESVLLEELEGKGTIVSSKKPESAEKRPKRKRKR